jgi:gas vesicle protein
MSHHEQEDQTRSSFGDFVTGIIIGGTIGYLAALLYAPHSGEETREMLTERGRDVRERAKDTVQTALDKTGKIVAESRERIGTTVDTTVNRTREKGETLVQDVREQASDKMHKVADQIDPNNPE